MLDERSRFLLHHELMAYERPEDAVEALWGAVGFAMRIHGRAAQGLVSDHVHRTANETQKTY